MSCSYCVAGLRDGQVSCPVCGAGPSELATFIPRPSQAGGTDAPTFLGSPLSSPDVAAESAPATPTGDAAPASVILNAGPLAPGSAFGSRYHIIRLLGIGGMGAVYQAWDDALGVAVALKIVRPEIMADPAAARDLERRFKRELLLARQVTHKNVVRIHDLGEIDGIKYLTMPYIQGSDLGTLLAREKRLPVARAVAIAKQIAAGLQAAHEAGIVHRDLKPANVMIDADDNAVIMDFGIARSIAGGAGTMAGAVIGTLEYMAPEQAMAQPTDHRADIYALGLILYDMAAGLRQTSRAESAVAELMARVQKPLAPLRSIDPSLPEGLERVVDRCTQPDPGARYQTTAELVADLQQLAPDGRLSPTATFSAPPVTRTTAPVAIPPARRRSPAVIAGVAILLLALAAGVWTLRDRFTSAAPAGGGKPVSLAIPPFSNATGDRNAAWLGKVLADMTRSELGQAPGLRLVASDRVTQILSDLRVPADGDITPATLERVAQLTSAEVVVAGQFVRFGNSVRLEATLHGPNRDGVPVQAEAANEGEIPQAVKTLSRALLERLAPPKTAGAARSALPGPSSASMAALKAYTEGEQLARRNKHLEARERFEQASREDPAFALAFARLAQTYRTLGYGNEAEDAARKAAELSEKLPNEQRYVIDAIRAGAANDTSQAIEAYERLERIAPNDSQLLFDLAKLYEVKGDLNRARDTFKRVVDADPKYIGALISMGQVEIRRRNFDEALKYLNPAYNEAVQTGNEQAKSAALHAMGVAFKRLNKPADALNNYEQALKIRRAVGDRRAAAATLNEMGQVQMALQRTDAAVQSYNESLEIRREINDRSGAALTMIGLGSIHEQREEYDKALDLYRQSLQIEIDLGNEVYAALCQHNIGSVYLHQGRYDDAMSYFQQALQVREKARVPSEVAETLDALADTQAKVGQFEAALTNYLKALDLRRKANDAAGAAAVSEGMAPVFAAQARYAAALDAQQSALKTFREQKDDRSLGAILEGYAGTLIMLGRPEPARAALKEASTLAEAVRSPRLAAAVLNTQGNSHYYAGDFKTAREAFAEALRTAQKAGSPELEVLAAIGVAKSEIKEGRAASATPRLRALAARAETLRLRPMAAECLVYLGEALLSARDAAGAVRELEAALTLSEKLGLRSVTANAHYLLSAALIQKGDKAAAARHLKQAQEVVQAIRNEAQTDDLLARDDIRRIVSAGRSTP